MGFNTTLLLSIMIVAIVTLSFSFFSVSVATNYNFTVDDRYQTLFDEYAETEQSIDTYQEIIEGGEINPEGQDQAVYKDAIVAAKQSTTVGKIAVNLLADLGRVFKINTQILGIVSLMILFLVISAFIAFLVSRKP